MGSYHNLKPTNCSFSADSSLLAVSFQEVITIWSPDTWELLTTLCQPPGVIRWDMLFYHSGYCICSLSSSQSVQTLSDVFRMGCTGFLRSLDVCPIQSAGLAFTKLFSNCLHRFRLGDSVLLRNWVQAQSCRVTRDTVSLQHCIFEKGSSLGCSWVSSQ